MAYTDCPLSTLPTTIDSFPRRQDLTLADLSLVQSFETKYASGDFAGANQIIEDNPTLKLKINNAETWNEMRDAIIALEHMFMTDIEDYITNVAQYQGTFIPSKSYKKYDIVDYVFNDAVNCYMVKYNNTPVGTLPTDLNYFAPQTLRGLQGVSGIGLSFKKLWIDITEYKVDESVSYLGDIYQCLIQNVGHNPLTSPTYWLKIMYLTPQIVTSTDKPTSLKSGGYWFKIVA